MEELSLKIKFLLAVITSGVLYGVLKWIIYLANKSAKEMNAYADSRSKKQKRKDELKRLTGRL